MTSSLSSRIDKAIRQNVEKKEIELYSNDSMVVFNLFETFHVDLDIDDKVLADATINQLKDMIPEWRP